MNVKLKRRAAMTANLIFIVLGMKSVAQSATPSAQDLDSPIIDVTSVKPNVTGGTSMSFSAEVNGFRAENVSIFFLLLNGYGVRDDQILRSPGWARTERYDILVKTSRVGAPHDLSSEEQRSVIRQLLASRFSIEAHYEVHQGSVLSLVVGKGGAKIVELPSSAPVSKSFVQNRGSIYGQAMSMDALANRLSTVTEKEVVDHTNLVGRYQIDLRWAPDDNPPAEATQMDGVNPPLYTAIQTELGLKLVPGKADVNVLVVDRIRRPEPN